jgi:hypothetical protein
MAATFTPAWTTGVAFHASASLANAGVVHDDIDLAAQGYYAAEVTVSFAITSGSPSGDLVIDVFGSANAGTTVDTESISHITIPFTAQATKIKRVPLAGPWRRVQFTNSTGVSGTLVATLAGLKQASA